MDTNIPSGSASPIAESGGLNLEWQSFLADPVKLAGVIVAAPVVTVFLWFTVAFYTSPLKKFPGPFLAGT